MHLLPGSDTHNNQQKNNGDDDEELDESEEILFHEICLSAYWLIVA